MTSTVETKAMRTTWGPGPLRDAVEMSRELRLKTFITDEDSEPLRIFSPEHHSASGDWYGEHVGKWLLASSIAARNIAPRTIAFQAMRTSTFQVEEENDANLGLAIQTVVNFLASVQEESGYLGTYSKDAACRFTNPNAPNVRTWDIWVHAWMILGLLRASEIEEKALDIAVRIGELLVTEFGGRASAILELGNHQGLSAAVIIEPLAELTRATGDDRYANLAEEIWRSLKRPDSAPDFSLGSLDAAEIGTGKTYQLCWILLGLARLNKIEIAEKLWQNIADHHLTPLGGPWGGIATHKEVFNAKGFFSPYGLVETCTTATWMVLSRELFLKTGKSQYAEAFETSLLNSLLGAIDENGHDWCYFTFPNGKRNNTYHWACCKSSGAMALEESAAMLFTEIEGGVSSNLWLSGECEFSDSFSVRQTASIGEESSLWIELCERQAIEMTIRVRIPSWGKLERVLIDGQPMPEWLVEGNFLVLSRVWEPGSHIHVFLNCEIQVVPFTYSLDHHGQEIQRTDYIHVRFGPYVYALGAVDGDRKEEIFRLARLNPAAHFSLKGTDIELKLPGRAPLIMKPYFEAGGRHDGAWRSTWLQVAWQ